MVGRLSDYLEVVEPFFSYELVSPAYRQRLRQIFDTLPLLELICLETRLDTPPSRVDASICVRHHERQILLSALQENALLGGEIALPFCEAWNLPSSLQQQTVPNIWIMYDIQEEKHTFPLTWVNIAVADWKWGADVNLAIIQNAAQYVEHRLTEAHWERFRKIHDCLPPATRIPAFGLMEARGSGINAIRFGVSSFYGFEEIKSFLKQVEWPGDLAKVEANYQSIADAAHHCDLNLSVGKELLPVLGIECYLDPENNAQHSRAFLSSLSQQGLCTEKKAQALVDWIGEQPAPHTWLDSRSLALRKASKEDAAPHILRRLLEVKLVYDPRDSAFAKAYPTFDWVY